MKKRIENKTAYRLINPGPLVMVSSLYDGRADITPIAWHMPVSRDPGMIALEIHKSHFIHDCVLRTKDFVINIPPCSMVEKVMTCGKCSGRDVDKFGVHGLAKEPSAKVRSPRLKGALAVIECLLHEDEHARRSYNIIIGRVTHAEAEEAAFSDHWLLESDDMKPLHHLGGKDFCATGNL